MAFDQNHIPKDLRPINVSRTITEEPRIAAASIATAPIIAQTPATSRNPEIFGNPDGSIPVFYPITMSDAGFVSLGYGNPAPWTPRLSVPVGSVNSLPIGFGYSPNLANRVVSNAVDHAGHDMLAGSVSSPHLDNRVNSNASNETGVGFGYSSNLGNRGSGSVTGVDPGSEEGVDDSVSGKKVKFLCSFGGKILPRPSDGMLRYVGGQTRVISVRREVTFNDLLEKMVDTYGQPVVIKYQLPNEDLDALVSVSCPDDLDNMMDEYEKLVERSSDGSAKLRVFLFSAMEPDASGTVQFGDLHDSGRRYFDAVNGITDGAGCGTAWKESIASATSTQNSDFSGTEAIDSSGTGQLDTSGTPTTGLLSPRGDLATSQDQSQKFVSVEPNPPVCADASAVSQGITMVNSVPTQTLSSQPEVEFESSIPVSVPHQQLGYDFQQIGMGVPPPAPHLQAYIDPRQEITNHADYMYVPAQMRFPSAQLLGTAGSVFTQQQSQDSNASAASHQYIPAVHMRMTPTSSHVAIRPTIVQPLVLPQQACVERYSDEKTYGTRIIQFPDPGFNAYQPHHPRAIVGGGYGWHPVAQTDHILFSDGSVSHQHVIFPEKFQRLEDCFMCQKALPHAHSDPLAPDQRGSWISTPSDSKSLHCSLHQADITKGQPLNRGMVGGGLRDGIVEQGVGARSSALSHVDYQVGLQQSAAVVFSHNEHERTTIWKTDDSDQSKISVPHGIMGVPGFTGIVLQSRPEDSVQQHQVSGQYQVKEEASQNKLTNGDISHFPVVIQASEQVGHECPGEYSSNMPRVVSKEDIADSCVSYDQLRSVEEMIETLCVTPEINNEQSKSHVDKLRKEEILGQRTQQLGGRDAFLDDSYKKPLVVLDSNHVKPTEKLPASTQPSILGNQLSYLQSGIGIHQLDSGEVLGNPAFPGVQPAYVIDRILQPKFSPTDVAAGPSNSNVSFSLSSSGRVVDVQDSPNSLFSSQDPWNLRHDVTHLPPPRPNKFLTKKEAFDTKDPFSENLASNAVEIMTDGLMGDGVPQIISNSKRDLNSEQAQSSKGSAEDIVKQELQAVTEGVVSSVFRSENHSPDSVIYEISESAYEASQDMKVPREDIEVQHKAKLEDKNKLPEKLNFRFPASEGNYRLQIIKNTDLEELRELGSGTFGTVYHGKWRGTDVAIKRINDRCFAGKPSEQERMIDDFWNEAIKLADLHHPNVVAFYGVVLDGPGGSVATVTEYMINGSLRIALQKNERSLDKRKRLLIAMDVAFGMEYLHGKNIVHFDLKSDNLLVNLRDPQRPICKVGDLGLSKVKCQTLISGGVRGTLPWMAPELLNGSSSLVSEKVDVFSFGIVLWELLTGEEPYADLHYGAIIGGIVNNTLRPPVPESSDPEWKSLMERCWASEPSDRPNFTEIASILRAMAAKTPPKGYSPTQQQPQS